MNLDDEEEGSLLGLPGVWGEELAGENCVEAILDDPADFLRGTEGLGSLPRPLYLSAFLDEMGHVASGKAVVEEGVEKNRDLNPLIPMLRPGERSGVVELEPLPGLVYRECVEVAMCCECEGAREDDEREEPSLSVDVEFVLTEYGRASSPEVVEVAVSVGGVSEFDDVETIGPRWI
jgi:hypothetical protein